MLEGGRSAGFVLSNEAGDTILDLEFGRVLDTFEVLHLDGLEFHLVPALSLTGFSK